MFPTAEKKTQLKSDSSVRLVSSLSTHQKVSERVSQSIIDLQAALGRPLGEKTTHGTGRETPMGSQRQLSSSCRPTQLVVDSTTVNVFTRSTQVSTSNILSLCRQKVEALFFWMNSCWFQCWTSLNCWTLMSPQTQNMSPRNEPTTSSIRARFYCRSALFLLSDLSKQTSEVIFLEAEMSFLKVTDVSF